MKSRHATLLAALVVWTLSLLICFFPDAAHLPRPACVRVESFFQRNFCGRSSTSSMNGAKSLKTIVCFSARRAGFWKSYTVCMKVWWEPDRARKIVRKLTPRMGFRVGFASMIDALGRFESYYLLWMMNYVLWGKILGRKIKNRYLYGTTVQKIIVHFNSFLQHTTLQSPIIGQCP